MQNKVFPFYYNTEDNEVITVRTMKDIDDDIWFVAKDVCDVLEIVDHHQAARRLDEDERGMYDIPTPGGNQKMTCINESGLYSLIFTSNKPEAKRFRKWVTSEVLPSIRKTGSYELDEKTSAIVPQVVESVIDNYKPRSNKSVPQGVMKAAKIILRQSGLPEKVQTLALDKVFQCYTGKSVLEMAGLELVKAKYGDLYFYEREKYYWKHKLLPD